MVYTKVLNYELGWEDYVEKASVPEGENGKPGGFSKNLEILEEYM